MASADPADSESMLQHNIFDKGSFEEAQRHENTRHYESEGRTCGSDITGFQGDITTKSVAQGRDPRLAPVSEIMRPEVFYCYDDQDVEEVARYMQEKEVRRMVILNRDKKLVGVVSLGDIATLSIEREVAGETLGKIAAAA